MAKSQEPIALNTHRPYPGQITTYGILRYARVQDIFLERCRAVGGCIDAAPAASPPSCEFVVNAHHGRSEVTMTNHPSRATMGALAPPWERARG